MEGSGVRSIYRSQHRSPELTYFTVKVKESDLAIGVDNQQASQFVPEAVERYLVKLRADIELYAAEVPGFYTSLSPLPMIGRPPEIVRRMSGAAAKAGVGPMAAVAGAIAEMVGEHLLSQGFSNVIVENGGDLYLASQKERTVAVYAGSSPFSGRLGVRVARGFPLGICTSSGTVGPSLSLGWADAAVIIADTAALADAVATQTGNLVKGEAYLKMAVEWALSISGVRGALVVLGDKLAAKGDVELIGI